MTEPTPKPTDALEDMRQHCERFRYQHDACGKCHVCIAIAAWEKERAEAKGVEECDTKTMLINIEARREAFKQLGALRAAVERIEARIRHNANCCAATCSDQHRWADELRAAREGGK